MTINGSITGYLEKNGSITKISSLEDIKHFVDKCGQNINTITESELDNLADESNLPENKSRDDCGVTYSTSPKILILGNNNKSYKVSEDTIAIADKAREFGYLKVYDMERKQNALKDIMFNNSLLIIGRDAFCRNSKLTNIIFPSSLIKISDEAFFGCSSISDVKLPGNLRFIGAKAFYNCAINNITIPASVESIGSHAFADNCIKSIEFKGVPNHVGSGVFDNNTIKEIKIPTGTAAQFEKFLFPLNKDLFIEV